MFRILQKLTKDQKQPEIPRTSQEGRKIELLQIQNPRTISLETNTAVKLLSQGREGKSVDSVESSGNRGTESRVETSRGISVDKSAGRQ